MIRRGESERDKTRQRGGEGGGDWETLPPKCLPVSSFLDQALAKLTGTKLILHHTEKMNKICFTVWPSIRLLYSFPSRSCVTFLNHEIPSVRVCECECVFVCVCVCTGKDIPSTSTQICMDVQFQIMQPIVLQRAKEGISSLNSNGTQRTTAGRLREHASLTTALKRGRCAPWGWGPNQMGVQRVPLAISFWKSNSTTGGLERQVSKKPNSPTHIT